MGTPSSPAQRRGEAVEIAVTDNGTGIAEGIRSQIFTPFFTTKGPNEGVGLGLTQALATVRAHGGVLDVDSAEGSHTTVTVVLPTRRPAQDRRME